MMFHIWQGESSHSPAVSNHGIAAVMVEPNETFRANLLAEMRKQNLTPAELSRRAGLNARAVKDIEERRAQSPKLQTVFALADALNVDAGDLIGLGPRAAINVRLATFLQQYDEADQERILQALEAFPALAK